MPDDPEAKRPRLTYSKYVGYGEITAAVILLLAAFGMLAAGSLLLIWQLSDRGTRVLLLAYGSGFSLLLWAEYHFLRKRVKGYRLQFGYCVRCGYDLTGNTSGICPECGKPVNQRVPPLR